jgi:hypothetical protein
MEGSSDWKGQAMSPEQVAFLNQRRLPFRLTAKQVGWLLGFTIYDITVLTSRRFLKPVGKPAPNSTKYFAMAQIVELQADVKWMDRATAMLNLHWREKNGGRTPRETMP